MTNKIISLAEKREQKNKAESKVPQPSAEVVKLWRLSMAMDDIIKSGVLEDKLPPEEVATIFANRLGTLINCCENSTVLAKFCVEIIERMNCLGGQGKGA